MEDLIFFVICKETSQSTQRPSALTEEGVPDRDRQKLIREQEVLKEVRVVGVGVDGGGGGCLCDCVCVGVWVCVCVGVCGDE